MVELVNGGHSLWGLIKGKQTVAGPKGSAATEFLNKGGIEEEEKIKIMWNTYQVVFLGL